MEFDFDAVVVGAGAVGLATGRALTTRGLTVLVLEREAAIGQGVSSRNSEVIHAGLYYPTGSLKARLCVEGRRTLYAYLDSRKIAYRRCGKLVVSVAGDDPDRLPGIAEQARTNGVEGLRVLSGPEAIAMEPGLAATGALWSPESGVFDSHGYMLALQGEIEDGGGAVALGAPFEGASPVAGGGWTVRAGGAESAEVSCRLLVTAPGLQAQGVASLIEGYLHADIPPGFFGKGVYFRLNAKAPFERLIYPLPIPGALGTHYRKDLGGQAVFGPDLEWVDDEDYSVDPAKGEEFAAYIRRFWPDLPDGALTPDYAGIRPKLHARGATQPDFRIDGPQVHGLAGVVALFGIESPGLTSSLAIGEAVANALDQ